VVIGDVVIGDVVIWKWEYGYCKLIEAAGGWALEYFW